MVTTLFLEIFASYFGLAHILNTLCVSIALPVLTSGCMEVNNRPL